MLYRLYREVNIPEGDDLTHQIRQLDKSLWIFDSELDTPERFEDFGIKGEFVGYVNTFNDVGMILIGEGESLRDLFNEAKLLMMLEN